MHLKCRVRNFLSVTRNRIFLLEIRRQILFDFERTRGFYIFWIHLLSSIKETLSPPPIYRHPLRSVCKFFFNSIHIFLLTGLARLSFRNKNDSIPFLRDHGTSDTMILYEVFKWNQIFKYKLN